MANIRPVLGGAQALGRVHRELRHARGELERLVEGLVRSWVTERAKEELLTDDGEDLDDLIEAAGRYLHTGEDEDDLLSPQNRSALEFVREWIAEESREARHALDGLTASLDAPAQRFASALRRWFADARSEGDLSAWPQILDAWRKALDLTTREAASALEVSPSAIVRYSSGDRRPSGPQVAAMVECMASWDPTAEDELRPAARLLARHSGGGEASEVLEGPWRREAERAAKLESTVEEALPGLTQEQLRLLAGLVTSPALLDKLVALVNDGFVFPALTEAVARVAGEHKTEDER